jgi:hypothetical protein
MLFLFPSRRALPALTSLPLTCACGTGAGSANRRESKRRKYVYHLFSSTLKDLQFATDELRLNQLLTKGEHHV